MEEWVGSWAELLEEIVVYVGPGLALLSRLPAFFSFIWSCIGGMVQDRVKKSLEPESPGEGVERGFYGYGDHHLSWIDVGQDVLKAV
jgi:hypothetical protein